MTGFEGYLNKIINNIDDVKVKGIAKKAISDGADSLTTKQRHVLNNGISDYILKICPNCDDEIIYDDMEIAIYNGMCGSCQYSWDKDQEE